MVDTFDSAVTYHFEYGTTVSYGTRTPAVTLNHRGEWVMAAIGGLSPSTTYYWRLVATNEWGTTHSNMQMLNTGAPQQPPQDPGPPEPPSILPGGGASASSAQAELYGIVESRAHDDLTYHFEYGPTPSYGMSTEPLADGYGGTGGAYALIGGLTPGTTYHFRMVATNTSGTSYGPSSVFTTEQTPMRLIRPGTVTVAVQPAVLRMGRDLGADDSRTFTAYATINPHGNAVHYTWEWGMSTAYRRGTLAPQAGRCAKNPDGSGQAISGFEGSSEVPNEKDHEVSCDFFAQDPDWDAELSEGRTVHAMLRRARETGKPVYYRLVAEWYNQYPSSGDARQETIYGPDQVIEWSGGGSPDGVAPTVKQVAKAVTKALRPAGPAAKLAAILKAGAYPAALTAPGAGKAKIVWYHLRKGARLSAKVKPVVVASGAKKVRGAGATVVKVRLSKKGKKLLKSATRRVKLTAQGTFTPTGGKKLTKRRAIKLKR